MPAHKAHDGTSWVNLAKSGRDGNAVLSGTGAPAPGLGKVGDHYIDKAVWNIYGPKTAGGWGTSTSLVGAPSSLYDANTMLAANADNTPLPLTVGASTLIGRGASGNIAALNSASVRSEFDLAQKSIVGNLLTDNQASGGDTLGNLTGINGGATACTVAYTGGNARITATGVGTFTMTIGTTWYTLPATPGRTYTAYAELARVSGSRTLRLDLMYSDAVGVALRTDYVLGTGASGTLSVTGVAPAGTVYVMVKPRVHDSGAIGDSIDVIRAGFWAGAGGEWAMPGTPITNLGTKVSHPNVDDVLVQRWDSSKATPEWQTIWYDSGWRDITALLNTAAWTAGTLYLRRVNNNIYLSYLVTATATPANRVVTLPAWFTVTNAPTAAPGYLSTRGGSSTTVRWCRLSANDFEIHSAITADGSFAGLMLASTNVGIPTSLPGTLVSAAPA